MDKQSRRTGMSCKICTGTYCNKVGDQEIPTQLYVIKLVLFLNSKTNLFGFIQYNNQRSIRYDMCKSAIQKIPEIV